MFGAAVLIGITTTLDNRAIASSSPEFFSLVYWAIVGLIFTIVALPKMKSSWPAVTAHRSNLFMLGIAGAGLLLLISMSFKVSTAPPLVSAVFSTNSLITILLAGTFLKEKGFGIRLLASASIFVGTLLIVLA